MRITRGLPVLLLVALSLVVVPASTASSQRVIAAGGQHSCALTSAGTVHCWGDNASGQATDQTSRRYTAIAAGARHSCAITAAGTVDCWGDNSLGQAADQTAGSYTAVAAGGQHSCALTSAGTVHCWGDSTSGQATDQTATTYTAVAAGARHSCALTSAGSVHCWGDNTSGQATDQTATTYTAVAAGARHSCAITTAGSVHCWGDNSLGQAADQTTTTYTAVAAGARHSCAITTAGSVHCWGDNSLGQAADQTDTTYSAIAAGGQLQPAFVEHSCAITTAGTVHCWGDNSVGQAPGSVTPITAPGAPTGVARTAGNGQVALTWAAPPSNGGSAITNYSVSVYDGSGGAASGVTGPTTRAVGSAATSYTFGGLTNGTAYAFRVAAMNAAGTGSQSLPSGSVIVGSPAPPGGVTVVSAWTSTATGSLRVSFTPGANNGSLITSFAATCTSTNSGVTRTASGTASPITVASLTTGKAYACAVKATNARGVGVASIPSASASVVVGAPSGVSAATGDGYAVVSWSGPTTSGSSPITGYDVTITPGGRVVEVTGGSAGSVAVAALTNGTAYTFTVAARTAAGPGPQSVASARVTPHVAVSIGDASVWEGSGFAVSASFAVSLREAAREPISLAYSVTPATATAGVDYVAASGTMSFGVGEVEKFITVTVRGDSTVEPTETFTVTLSHPTKAILADASGVGTIRDDDALSGQSLAVSDASVNEGDSGERTVQLEIRAKANAFPIYIAYSVVRGSAADADFVASPPQTLRLTGPNTLRTFTVKPDYFPEGDERFGIFISSNTIPVRDPRGVVTIVDNDLRVAPKSPLLSTVTTSDVWTPPTPVQPGKPGDVIWSVPTSSAVPAGATSRTMLYRSRSALGVNVSVSAWVVVPDGTPPAGGWPVLAWGHWTQGMDDSCAPTRRWSPTGIPYIDDFVAARYVVVAPDYEGLGTPGPTPYWAAESYAHTLLDSIRAARNLVPGASSQAVLFGGSEGGLAATAAAELWRYYAPEIDLRGAVGSGPGVGTSLARVIAARNAKGLVGNSLAMIAGQNNAYPGAGIPAYFLTPAGIDALDDMQTVCSDQYANYANTTGLFRNWLAADRLVPPAMSADLASVTDRDSLANRAPSVPVLYVHGRYDTSFPPVLLPPFVQRLCDLGSTVELRWYDDGHMPFTTSRTDVLAWIAARFADAAPPTSCGHIPHAENVAPTVISIVRAAANPTSASSVSWTVTFSEAVTGVAKSNFSLASTGPTGASITGLSGTGTTRTVTASTGSGDGGLRLDLSDTSGIIDAAANQLSTTFTGSAYTIDKTP